MGSREKEEIFADMVAAQVLFGIDNPLLAPDYSMLHKMRDTKESRFADIVIYLALAVCITGLYTTAVSNFHSPIIIGSVMLVIGFFLEARAKLQWWKVMIPVVKIVSYLGIYVMFFALVLGVLLRIIR